MNAFNLLNVPCALPEFEPRLRFVRNRAEELTRTFKPFPIVPEGIGILSLIACGQYASDFHTDGNNIASTRRTSGGILR